MKNELIVIFERERAEAMHVAINSMMKEFDQAEIQIQREKKCKAS